MLSYKYFTNNLYFRQCPQNKFCEDIFVIMHIFTKFYAYFLNIHRERMMNAQSPQLQMVLGSWL